MSGYRYIMDRCLVFYMEDILYLANSKLYQGSSQLDE